LKGRGYGRKEKGRKGSEVDQKGQKRVNGKRKRSKLTRGEKGEGTTKQGRVKSERTGAEGRKRKGREKRLFFPIFQLDRQFGSKRDLLS